MDSFKDNKAKKKLQHQKKTQSEPNGGPLEPKVLVPIKEDRNGCYDNICANIDRGMPGHPLEKDIQQQEAREQSEKENDYKYYRSIHYPESSIWKHNEANYASEVLRNEFGTRTKQNHKYNHQEDSLLNGPLESEHQFSTKEDSYASSDNTSSTIEYSDNDRNKRSLHYPESSIWHHNEANYASEVLRSEFGTRTKQNRQLHSRNYPPNPSKGPFEPQYLVPVKSDRNGCYDNISANIDRGMPGHPLEREMQQQEMRENAEIEDDDRSYRSLHYPESSIWKHNEANYASDVLRSEFGTRPDDGELMQLEEPDDDFSFSSDSSVERMIVRPPTHQNASPRIMKQFISSYDPKIFYPKTPKRNSPPKVVHNVVKDPVKLKVSLKEIGLDGLDDMIPVKTVQNLQRERMNREKMKPFSNSMKVSVIKPTNQNQTNLSKSMTRTQFKAAATLDNKQQQFLDYSSDDSYSEHQFELDEIEVSPPPSPIEIKSDKNEEEIDDKPFTLNVIKNDQVKIEEPVKKKDAPRSPRRKKEIETKSTYDPSIFYTPLSSPVCEPATRVKGVNRSKKYPIKLNVSLKDIGLEGLDAVPSGTIKHQEKMKHKSRPRNY